MPKISELTAITELTASDIIMVTDAETSASKKITWANIEASIGPSLTFESDASNGTRLILSQAEDGTDAPDVQFKKARGTHASPTTVQTSDALGRFNAFAYDGSAYVQAGNFGAIRTFAEYASEPQLKKFLPKLLAGKGVMSVGMSEPDAGSSVTDLKTSATPDGDDFLINGSKVFGTNSAEAEVFLIYLRFGPGVDGIGSAIIEKGTPGFEIGPSYRYMNGEFWSPLYFDNCRIPESSILLGAGGCGQTKPEHLCMRVLTENQMTGGHQQHGHQSVFLCHML